VVAHPPFEADEPSPWERTPNLFAGAKVSVSGHWNDRVAEFAVDGRHDSAGEHWGADGLPAYLTVELDRPRALNAIRLWTFWNGKRAYQYLIEGSLDANTWTTLADRRKNTRPATAAGEVFHFPEVSVQYVRTTITGNSEADNGHIVEIEGYRVPQEELAAAAALQKSWQAVPPGLCGAVGSKDVRYRRGEAPKTEGRTEWSGVAWRGERVAAQCVLWTQGGAEQVRFAWTPLRTSTGQEIPAAAIRPQFVRYVLSSAAPGDSGPLSLEPDVLDLREKGDSPHLPERPDQPAVGARCFAQMGTVPFFPPRLDLKPCTSRPVWLTIDVPPDAVPGRYQGELTVAAADGAAVKFSLSLEVLPLVLPPPSKWAFRLDLWQDPWSVAWYHGVEPWSEGHWKVLEPHLRMLADAGQKYVTTYITFDPWGESTYIDNGTMVEWIRRPDGSFRFDYSVFDRYVEFAQKCGITEAITCYTPIPWGHRVRYLDEASGDYVWVAPAPGTPEYKALWTPLLKDLAAHLKEKGWLEKTYMGINENPWKDGQACIDLVRSIVPDMKVTWAGRYCEELKDQIDDWCFILGPPVGREVLRQRAAQGRTTTFYICCGPARPNTFTFSPPAEAAWQGWYAAAQGYDGFLRWAYDSWVRDPLYDTRHVRWPAGDCFLVYPGPRSSIRFERLREGIADWEKIRIVRRMLGPRKDARAAEALRRLDAVLGRFTYEAAQQSPAADAVNEAQQVLIDVAREAARDNP